MKKQITISLRDARKVQDVYNDRRDGLQEAIEMTSTNTYVGEEEDVEMFVQDLYDMKVEIESVVEPDEEEEF